MKLIKESYLLMLIVFGLLSLSLYSTYALFTASTTINNVVSFEATLTTNSNIIEYEMVTVAAGETKIIEVNVSNSYGSTLYYGAWYEILSGSSSDIELGLYTEEDNTPSSGQLSSGSSTTLLVGIANNGSSNALVNIGTIGSLTSSLGLVSPRTLLPSGWEPVSDNTFANTIIKLSKGDTWSSGASGVYKTNDHEYRYIGAGVNNYVSFNNDIYRIIGVFDSNSHGVTGQNLVKLIPANVMTANSWGAYNSSNTSGTYSSYKNDWTGATTGIKANLNVLLNEYFYNKTSTSSTYGDCSNWTYYYTSTNYRTNDCALITGYGINSTYQNYIENVTWYLYGFSGNGLSKQNFYLCERGQYGGCTSANSGAYSTSTQAKAGLMYVSDYMYASGYYSNSDTATGSSYYYGNKNWLYQGYEWTITPRSSNSNYAFNVDDIGDVNHSYTRLAYAVRPTFYLKSTVYVTGGDGTFSNPYTISM